MTQSQCNHCRTSTHNGSACRRTGTKEKVNRVVTKSDEAEHSFVFRANMYEDDRNSMKTDMLLVDCGATSHIITDESKFDKFDKSFQPENYMELADGTKSNNVALKRGIVKLSSVDTNGSCVDLILTNVLYVPSYPQDIFSVQAATDKGASVVFKPKYAELIHKSGAKITINKHGRLYYLKTYTSTTDSVNYTGDLKSWHEILGHCNHDDVLQLESVVDGMKVSGDATDASGECEVCILGKMTQSRSRNARVRSTAPLQLVHTDLAGPVEPAAKEGFRYAVVFADDYSGALLVYFLKGKNDTVAATEKFLADCAPYGDVRCIRSDNGTEFMSETYQSLLRKNKIEHDPSAPYSPHQNGTAERQWRTLFEMGRCLLIQAKLGKELWTYAVMAAAYIRNRCYNRRLKQTPYAALTGRKPNLSNMRVFGCECFAYKQQKKKLDSRCNKGVFVGYDRHSPAYLVYFPETGKVVKFPTNRATVEQSKVEEAGNDDDDFMLRRTDGQVTENQNDRAGGECVPENTEGRNERYPRRERKTPRYLEDYVTSVKEDDLFVSSVDYCYRVSAFPETYTEAIVSPESECWKVAMNEEMNSLKENHTFSLTSLPEGKETVGGRWVYTIKERADG